MISDKDENAINNGKQFVLFYFRSSRPEVICKKGEKYLCQSLFFKDSDIGLLMLIWKIYKNDNTLINFLVTLFIRCKFKWAISASAEVPASLVFAAITEFWFSFLIKINNKKLDQIISAVLFCFGHVEHFWTSQEDIYIIVDNN